MNIDKNKSKKLSFSMMVDNKRINNFNKDKYINLNNNTNTDIDNNIDNTFDNIKNDINNTKIYSKKNKKKTNTNINLDSNIFESININDNTFDNNYDINNKNNYINNFYNNSNSSSNSSNNSNNNSNITSKINNNNYNTVLNNILPRKTYTWINDDSATECYSCNYKFDIFYRKHHCRLCGRIFCYKCSEYYIKYHTLNKYQLIDREKYLDFFFNTNTNNKNNINSNNINKNSNSFQLHRICKDCKNIVKKIKKLSKYIKILELLPLDIESYYIMSQLNKDYYEAVLITLSKIREIQYHLPGHIYTNFETKFLSNNLNDIIGHNKYMKHYLKSLNYKTISNEKIYSIINVLKSRYITESKTYSQSVSCMSLMCSRECCGYFDESDIIDLLLHIENDIIKEYLLSNFYICNEKLLCFIPILTYCIRMDGDLNPITNFIIDRCNVNIICSYFYWELKLSIEENNFCEKYSYVFNYFLKKIQEKYGNYGTSVFIKQQEITSDLFTNNNRNKTIDKIKNNDINIDTLYKLPYGSDYIEKFHYNNIKFINSATKPLLIPYSINNNILCNVLYKNEDIRKDKIIVLIIKLFDIILKEHGLDYNIITYNALSTSLNSGIVEIIDSSTTIYDILNIHKTNLLNHILEKNSDASIEKIRSKFIKSLASYSVITYLLGIGDRHMDNILIRDDGCIFHIDFSFILGQDPKFFSPEIRITDEMINALGGVNSKNFDEFINHIHKVYGILRRYSDLVYNLLYLLTKINNQNIDINILRNQVHYRFLPGELETKANLRLDTTLSNCQNNSNFIDYFHFQSKESSIVKGFSYIYSKFVGN